MEVTGEPGFFVWMFDIDGSAMGSLEVNYEFHRGIRITGPNGALIWECELPMPKVQEGSVDTAQVVGNMPTHGSTAA